jgi:hypothetical protein
MRHNIKAALLAAVIGLFVSTDSASAGTVGPSCGSCYGSIYTLSYLGQVAESWLTETHRVSLTIDASGFTEPTSAPNQYITSVALKISNLLLWGALESAPGGTGSWNSWFGGLNANNCSGAGVGWFCTQDIQPNAAQTNVANPIYEWVFRLTIAKGTLFLGTDQASIKANYDPVRGMVMSENVTLGGEVPEPATISLLAAGIGVWAWSRRRSQSVSAL